MADYKPGDPMPPHGDIFTGLSDGFVHTCPVGTVWVSLDQAAIAHRYGWQTVPDSQINNLVQVTRK